MATASEVTEAKQEAQLALLKRITQGVGAKVAPQTVSEWALAYRYLAGGAQPGNTTVEK